MGINSFQYSPLNDDFYRTSVSVDEAVAMLLGRIRGPVRYKSLNENSSAEDQELLDSVAYSLLEDLRESREDLREEYAIAVDDKNSEVADKKREAINEHAALEKKAKTYLCDINDALNSQSSTLQIDRRYPSATYITISSLLEWAKENNISFGTQQEGLSDHKDEFTQTTKESWFVTCALLVEALSQSSNTFRINDKPNVSEISKRLESLSKKSEKSDPMDGQSYNSIKKRLAAALKMKTTLQDGK
jgi:hypothetical protein